MDAMKELDAAVTDGDFLRIMAAGTREQIPEASKTYEEVLIMQAMAARMEQIADRLKAFEDTARSVGLSCERCAEHWERRLEGQ